MTFSPQGTQNRKLRQRQANGFEVPPRQYYILINVGCSIWISGGSTSV
jgi:hypothetical protein